MNNIPNKTNSLIESEEDLIKEHIFIYTGVKRSKYSDNLIFKSSDPKMNRIRPISGLP